MLNYYYKSFYLQTIVFVILLINFSEECGTSTHINIAHQAFLIFKTPSTLQIDYAEIINKHQDAFVAGNPYPDAMYPSVCFGGRYHDVAEDTHWAEFLNVSINYVQKNYPLPWNLETEKLVAFIFGLVSHQVADVTWHSLGIQQGFIRAMSAIDFHNIYDVAHTTADVGGDMLTQFDNDDKPVGISSWYVPVEDLYQIYKEYYNGNLTVPRYVIEVCSSLLYIEYFAEKYGGAEIFQPFAKKSPFLLKHLNDYFIGGIHDMASWTTLIWNQTAYMFEHGTKHCKLHHNTLFIRCHNFTVDERYNRRVSNEKNPGRSYPLRLAGWNVNHVEKMRTEKGVFFSPGTEMKEYMHDHHRRQLQNQQKQEQQHHQDQQQHNQYQQQQQQQQYHHHHHQQQQQHQQQQKQSVHRELVSLASKCPYSTFGSSMTSIKIQNELKLVIGAPNFWKPGLPQQGRVYIVSLETFLINNTIEESSNVITLASDSPMEKFGWALSTVDWNEDGYEDLAVSAPVFGADYLQYTGRVYIYYATRNGISLKPDAILEYYNKTQYTNFGFSMKTCSNRLYISSPFHMEQKGVVIDVSYMADNGKERWEMFGVNNYSWFGFALDCSMHHERDYIFVVGSPSYRKCYWRNCTYDTRDQQSIGKLDVFVNGKLFVSLYGESSFSQFGSSVSIGRPFNKKDYILAVASPSKDISSQLVGEIPYVLKQAGEVVLYNLTSLLSFSLNPEKSIIAKYQGDRAYGRFGDSIKFVDVNSDGKDELIVSAPRRTADWTELLFGREEGAVFIFNAQTMNGIATSECCFLHTIPCPTDVAQDVFKGAEAGARFGTSFQVIPLSNKSVSLFISAPKSSYYGFRVGSVYMYNL